MLPNNYMLIGIDASRANQNQKTGVGWYSHYLIQELKKNIPENVRVVLYTDKSLQGELANLPKNWQVKVLKWLPQRLWTQIRLSWEMLFHRPDVLFIPAHVFPIIHPKKTVMTIHDIAAIRFPEAYNKFECWYSIWSAKYAVKKLWKVITPTNFTKKELQDVFKIKGDNIKVIYHGYNKKYEQIYNGVVNKQILDKYKLNKPFIMTIGRLEEKKNTVNIIKSFAKIKNNLGLNFQDLKLVLVGSHGYGYLKIKEIIKKSLYKKDIIILGWVEENDLSILLKNAEVFVFPSLYEGFGLPILEAMASGIPVVSSNINSLKEVGGEAIIYINSSEVEDISQAILNLLQNKDLRLLKIKQGYERVKHFSWEKCAKETLKLLLT